MNKRGFGRTGECSAALFLERCGFEIVGRNVYVGRCEIDIIAKNAEFLLFAEVKTRRQIPGVKNFYGRPATAVNAAKKQNLLAAARRYLYEHREEVENLQPRIDIIEVYVDPKDPAYRVLDILHFPNAVHG